MRLFRTLLTLAFVLFAGSAVLADGNSTSPPPPSLTPIALGSDGTIDSTSLIAYDGTLVPNDSGLGAAKGPTGSPPVDPTITVSCPESAPKCTSATVDYTVESGTVTMVTMTLTGNVGTFFCGPSDAFLNVNFYSTDDTCTYEAYTGPAVSEPPETVGQMEEDCFATNLANFLNLSSLYSDPDDCAGVPAGTNFSDLVLSQFDTAQGAHTDADVIISPEPGSYSLLLLGMAGLLIFRRKMAY
jgi:hypothetical protein